MLRALQRIARRANLPLHYSGGFNPRPQVSLPCPRPTGIASRDDRFVLTLDEPVEPAALCRALNDQTLPGLSFRNPHPLEPNATPQPRKVSCQAELTADQARTTQSHIDTLARQDAWPVTRTQPARPRRGRAKPRPPRSQKLDLKDLVENLRLEDRTLHFDLVAQADRWAKPAELLGLLGLVETDEPIHITRTRIQDET